MKTKTLKKKLMLNKKTIVHLNGGDLDGAKGGMTITCPSGFTVCVTGCASICPNCDSVDTRCDGWETLNDPTCNITCI